MSYDLGDAANEPSIAVDPNGTVSFTSSPPRTYMGDGFTNT
jgi:hypothetical protein